MQWQGRRALAANDDAQNSSEAITLSFLLNLLDGVLETPGRILVITSNYPEKLDKALVRPGRIDVKIEFKNASREVIREMVARFYSNPDLALDVIPCELDNVFTPAEVMESLCTYFKDTDGAIKHMVKKLPAQKPCLNVQELPPLPPSRNDSTVSKDLVVIKEAEEAYAWAIDNCIAKEQARAVLPEGLIESRLYMNGTLRSWIHFIELRSANGTQLEHQEVAIACAKVIAEIFPMTSDLVAN
jgi:hypothetical protein